MSEKISARQPYEKRASVVCTGKLSGFFEGWGSVFLFASFDAPVWMYCGLWEASRLTFLLSISKLDFEECRRLLESVAFVWCACFGYSKCMYCFFELCNYQHLYKTKPTTIFSKGSNVSVEISMCYILPSLSGRQFGGGVGCCVCNPSSIKPFFQRHLNSFQVLGAAKTTIKMTDWLLNRSIISKVKQMPACQRLYTANKEC